MVALLLSIFHAISDYTNGQDRQLAVWHHLQSAKEEVDPVRAEILEEVEIPLRNARHDDDDSYPDAPEEVC
jgi:hypothetical protein